MIIKAVLVIFFLSPAIFAATYTDQQARTLLVNAGIKVTSSGGCTDQNNPSCTSLNGIHSDCIDGTYGIIKFNQASGCSITITGGTEVGHASGTYSHANGWKLDVSMSVCITNYIAANFHKTDSTHWTQTSSGYVYYNENNHWDITFHS